MPPIRFDPDRPRFNPEGLLPSQRVPTPIRAYPPGGPPVTYFRALPPPPPPRPAPAPAPRPAAPAPRPAPRPAPAPAPRPAPVAARPPAPRPAPSPAPVPRPAPRPVVAPPPPVQPGPTPQPQPPPPPPPPPAQWFPAVPRDWNAGAEAIRAQGGHFDPNFLQNLALFSAQNLQRPGGQLQFDPTGGGQGQHGLDQFGQQIGSGNAPLHGLPQTLLGEAIQRNFHHAVGHWGPGQIPPGQQQHQAAAAPAPMPAAPPQQAPMMAQPQPQVPHPTVAPAARAAAPAPVPAPPRPIPQPQSAGNIVPAPQSPPQLKTFPHWPPTAQTPAPVPRYQPAAPRPGRFGFNPA